MKQSWEWSDQASHHGVHTYEGQLLWWSRPKGAGGRFGEAAGYQSFGDYLENGPAHPAPAHVIAELYKVLQK